MASKLLAMASNLVTVRLLMAARLSFLSQMPVSLFKHKHMRLISTEPVISCRDCTGRSGLLELLSFLWKLHKWLYLQSSCPSRVKRSAKALWVFGSCCQIRPTSKDSLAIFILTCGVKAFLRFACSSCPCLLSSNPGLELGFHLLGCPPLQTCQRPEQRENII